MKKRLIPLLALAVTLVLLTAPPAMADHCSKCSATLKCVPAATGGRPICTQSPGSCTLSGALCTGPHPLIEEEQLASEYTVASVERLDEPRPAASETQVASAETTAPANR